jgi:hypothetical protein
LFNIAPYLKPAQVLFILAFVAWWLLGSSWLLQRALRTKAGRRGQELGPCILGMLMAGLASAAVGGLMAMLVVKIGETPESTTAYRVPAVIVGALAVVPTAILVLYASLQLPLAKVATVSWPALASVVVAGAALGTPAVWMSLSLRDDIMNATTSISHMRNIDRAIREYEQYFENQPPANLPMLTEEMTAKGKPVTLLAKTELACPFLPGEPVGYFYFPCPSLDSQRDRNSRALRVCEWTHPGGSSFHGMLLANGEARSNPDQDFQSMLSAPENKDFAAQFRAAEANRR